MISVLRYCIFIFGLKLAAPRPNYDGTLLTGEFNPLQEPYLALPNQHGPETFLRHPPGIRPYENHPPVPLDFQGPPGQPMTVPHQLRGPLAPNNGTPQQIINPGWEQWPQSVPNYGIPYLGMHMPIIPQPPNLQNPRLQAPSSEVFADSHNHPAPLQYEPNIPIEYDNSEATARSHYPVYQQQPLENVFVNEGVPRQHNWESNPVGVSSSSTKSLVESKASVKESILSDESRIVPPNIDPIKNLYDNLNTQFEKNQYSPEFKIRHLLKNNPELRRALAPPNATAKKRYVVIHEDGTVEHVEHLDQVEEQFPDYILVKAGQPRNKNAMGTGERGASNSKSEVAQSTNVVKQTAFDTSSGQGTVFADAKDVSHLIQKPYWPVQPKAQQKSIEYPVQSQYWPGYTQPQAQLASSPNPYHLQPVKSVVPQAQTNEFPSQELSTVPVNSNPVQNQYWSQYSQAQVQTTDILGSAPQATLNSIPLLESGYLQYPPVHPQTHQTADSAQEIYQSTAANTQTATTNQQTMASSAAIATSSVESGASSSSTATESFANTYQDQILDYKREDQTLCNDTTTEPANAQAQNKVNGKQTMTYQATTNVQPEASSEATQSNQEISADSKSITALQQKSKSLTSKTDNEQQEIISTKTAVVRDDVEVNNKNTETSCESETETTSVETSKATTIATHNTVEMTQSENKDENVTPEDLMNKALELLLEAAMLSKSGQKKEGDKSVEWFSTADPDFWSKLVGDFNTTVYFFQAPSILTKSTEDNVGPVIDCADDKKPPVTV